MSLSDQRSSSRDKAKTPNDTQGLVLEVLPHPFGICRLDPTASVPDWAERGAFSSISRSAKELSVLCEHRHIPKRVRAARGWSAIQIIEPLGDPVIGVLSMLAHALNDQGISMFAVSTYESDYAFIRQRKLKKAIRTLEAAGHQFRDPAPAKTVEAATVSETTDTAEGPTPPLAPQADQPRQVLGKRPERKRRRKRRPSSDSEPETAEAKKSPRPQKKPQAEIREASAVEGKEEKEHQPSLGGRPSEDEPVVHPMPPKTKPSELDDAADAADQPVQVESSTTQDPKESADERTAKHKRRRRQEPVEERDLDEGAVATGLFTGAIPQPEVTTTETTFELLGLADEVLRTIDTIGFKNPTPIQAAVLPKALAGQDIIGLAETGSGKTAAFVLPLVERLRRDPGGTRGLILCPTREIALQTKAFLDAFSKDHELESLSIIGGVKMGPQIQGLKRGADILVATPGRLADHLRRRNARLGRLEFLVLDEADHMLDLGFLPQIQEILEQIPESRQTLMFSATMPSQISSLAQRFMKDPVRIDFRPEDHMAEGIEHRLYLLQNPDDKKKCLLKLLGEVEGSTLVFTRRRLDAEWLARQLEQDGVQVERIHSDRSQAHRVRALRAFREGRHRVLVATDVAARGIDIPRIGHVINFELPDQVEDYVHRAGRTARGNAVGVVSSICSWQDKPKVKEIELDLGIKMPRCEIDGVQAFVEVARRKNVRRRRLL